MLVGRTRRAVLNGAGILAVGIATMAFLADRSALAEVMRVSPDRFVAGLSERIMAVMADRSASAEQRDVEPAEDQQPERPKKGRADDQEHRDARSGAKRTMRHHTGRRCATASCSKASCASK